MTTPDIAVSDDLAPARGCIIATILSLTLWAALALALAAGIYIAAWQVMP